MCWIVYLPTGLQPFRNVNSSKPKAWFQFVWKRGVAFRRYAGLFIASRCCVRSSRMALWALGKGEAMHCTVALSSSLSLCGQLLPSSAKFGYSVSLSLCVVFAGALQNKLQNFKVRISCFLFLRFIAVLPGSLPSETLEQPALVHSFSPMFLLAFAPRSSTQLPVTPAWAAATLSMSPAAHLFHLGMLKSTVREALLRSGGAV